MVADYLIKYGIKPSVQRIAVMEYLLANKTHPTVDEIYSALSPSMPTLSKTTVYNTLSLFSERGAALCISIDDKNARFDGDISNHAHFMCLDCGHIYDLPVSETQFGDLAANVGEFSVDEVHVYYKGVCKRCKNNN